MKNERLSRAMRGNANAASPRGRAVALWNRGRFLRPEDRWAGALVREYTENRLADLGGDPTAGQRSLIQTAGIAHATCALILRACAEGGGLVVKDADGQTALAPAAKELARFLKVVQSAEVALGLERKARPVASLAEVLNVTPSAGSAPKAETS